METLSCTLEFQYNVHLVGIYYTIEAGELSSKMKGFGQRYMWIQTHTAPR